MDSVYAGLAAAVVVVHLLFVVFATLGGLLVLRMPMLAVAHLPAVLWAVFIEFTGGVCPLTPLENLLRERAGLEPYTGDFIAEYVFPVLYPQGLTREMQVLFGGLVLGLNLVVYVVVAWKHTRRRRRGSG